MTTTTQAIAQVQHNPAREARALVAQYQPEFSVVLPSHIKSEAWVRRAAGALKKRGGSKDNGQYTILEMAATNNPQSFINALREAAGMGLNPGTDEYYLTPRPIKGQMEILGIVGYQGYVELMYRAGAVQSVIVETVYSSDKFTYVPGRDDRPIHEIDWTADDRGDLILAYAYAIMKGGAVSKVVVLNKKRIKEIRAKATGGDSEYSPWQTNPDGMWLKSAARQLRKWVPTSAEYITTQLRAAREAEGPGVTIPPIPHNDNLPTDEVIEGELMPEGS
jgi:recombination protein RecT